MNKVIFNNKEFNSFILNGKKFTTVIYDGQKYTFKGEISFLKLEHSHSGMILLNRNSSDLYMWGKNSAGQLGSGSTEELHIPTLIQSFSNITHFSLGNSHSALMNDNKELYMLGSNAYGRLWNRSMGNTNIPILIKTFDNVTHLSLGSDHSGVVDNNKLYM